MIKSRLAQLGLAMAALGFTAVSPVIGLSTAHAAETLRPEIGRPLQAAQKMISQGNARGALSELRKLDGVSGKSANESYLIERVRASAASSAGDYDTAARSFETLIASGRLSASESAKFSEGLVGIYMRAKEYGKANAAIQKALAKGDDARLRGYLVQNYISMGNNNEAMRLIQSDLQRAEKSGRAPQEDQLKMLANLQNMKGDKEGYVKTIEKLAQHYPQPSYWADLLNRVTGKAGFSSRLSADVLRLRLANNQLKKPNEYMELAQLALRDGAPGEAVKIIKKGYDDKVLGVGGDAARHQRLKDLADKSLAEQTRDLAATEAALIKANDQDGLVKLGYSLVHSGQADKGLKMMEAAIKAGGLKYPEDAKLHLGQAYATAGKKQQAIATLKTVGGKDGAADLARYWIMAINKPMA
ncbi:lipopolysaccharide assembly protein LapB [Massilia sp. PAMC28688]|uniref:tetratricopeptide repeat protein n=1 Tax=Massilia sp. PAMC28688 TaxID=2861283 RepID=UPI001E2CE820|nr:tetratricopeptide repeat protein [Massilia sp. PAMC28688]